jgi:DNA primase
VEHWAKCIDTLGALARGRVVVIALDVDAAGERHVGELAKALRGAGAGRIDRVRPTTGKDWCDVLQQGGPT